MLSQWLNALETRHLADLTFSEAARALRALSSTYVQRRDRLARTTAFDSKGKRAAYALYYGPLHFLTVTHIVDALGSSARPIRHLLDLGCGGGAAGAAWASRLTPPPVVTGIDEHPWALQEAALTYRAFGLNGTTRRGNAAQLRLPRSVDGIIAGWTINELDDRSRDAVRQQLVDAASSGTRILVVEPIATRVSPWWRQWADAFAAVGGRADEWRFQVELPDLVSRFDRATGLRHDELTARSLSAGY